MPKSGSYSGSPVHDEPARLRQAIGSTGIATLIHLEETGSTMDAARSIVQADGGHLPVLVIADRQSAGRGRRGNQWWQPPGALAATAVYDVGHLGGRAPIAAWSIACGVAMAEALRSIHADVKANVKWPNDVFVGPRKISGCLVETLPCAEATSGAVALFGIGVNTCGHASDAPVSIRDRVATVPDLVGAPMSRGALLESFLPRLESLCRGIAARPESLVERYEPLCCLTGRSISLHTSTATGPTVVNGRCLGIDPDGALRLLTTQGVQRFISGSVATETA